MKFFRFRAKPDLERYIFVPFNCKQVMRVSSYCWISENGLNFPIAIPVIGFSPRKPISLKRVIISPLSLGEMSSCR